MKRLELRNPDPVTDARPFGRPVTLFFSIATALVVLALTVPFGVRQMQQVWRLPASAAAADKAQVEEPWPTPPPTYAAVALVEEETTNPIPTPTPMPTPVPPPVWQELNYLTSIEFAASSVVVVQRTTDLTLPGEIVIMSDLITDRLLLKAVGKVQVGINLGRVSNVKIDGDKISLVIPRPEVISVELLPEQSQIYDSIQVWLLSQYQGLEKEALEQAHTQLHAEVNGNASMMKLAGEMARVHLTEFLEKTGFTTVDITLSN